MESIVAAWNDMVGGISCIIEFAAHQYQGILNEVWKHKLIFVETPDANETSIALENYRRVRKSQTNSHHIQTPFGRPAIMVVVLCYCLLLEAKCRRESILIIIMDAL